MSTSYRVRAIIQTTTPDNTPAVLLIKRVRPDRPVYWVAPGGGVDSSDLDEAAALHREVREELGATITIQAVAFTITYATPPDSLRHRPHETTQQTYYLCRLVALDPDQRGGPEFEGQGIGDYIADVIPLQREKITHTNIKPDEFQRYLLTLCE